MSRGYTKYQTVLSSVLMHCESTRPISEQIFVTTDPIGAVRKKPRPIEVAKNTKNAPSALASLIVRPKKNETNKPILDIAATYKYTFIAFTQQY
jgi:hypothetical protein